MPSFSSASCWPCGCRRLKPGLAEDLAAAPMPRRPASRPASARRALLNVSGICTVVLPSTATDMRSPSLPVARCSRTRPARPLAQSRTGTQSSPRSCFSQALVPHRLRSGPKGAAVRPSGRRGILGSSSRHLRSTGREVCSDQGGHFGRKQVTVATATGAEGHRSGSCERRGEQESSRRPRRPRPRSRRPGR